MLQPLFLGTLFPVARSLLGKQLGWFPDAGLKKSNNHFLERERALPKPHLGRVRLGLSWLEKSSCSRYSWKIVAGPSSGQLSRTGLFLSWPKPL